ncbi:MAG: Tetracycline resistance protein, class C [Candidatus Heimdallarchaeota archaeon LC_3]|nr:MAG: Tetracycline resistance protein, class C [Candidatus Heimdallarchaeota archaeon LC_3]
MESYFSAILVLKLTFEDTLLTRSNRRTAVFNNLLTKEISVVLILASSTTIVNIGFGMILPIYPKFLAQTLDKRKFVFGLTLASYAIGQLTFAPIVGYLADSKNIKKLLIILSLLGYSLSNFLFPFFIYNYEIIIFIRFIQGVTTAGIIPISLALISDQTDIKNRTRYFGLILGMSSMGWVIGPMIGSIFYEMGDYSLPFIIIALSSLISVIFIFFLLKTSNRSNVTKEEKAKGKFRKKNYFRKKNFSVSSILLPGKTSIFLSLLLISFIDYWAWALLGPGLPFYVFNILKVTTLEFGIFLGLYGAIIAIGQLFLGNVSDKFNKKNIIFLAGLFHFFGYVILGFASTFTDLLFMAFVTGIGMALLVPAITSYLTEIAQVKYRSFVISLLIVGTQSAGILAPILGGYLGMIFPMEVLIWISTLSLLSIPVILLFGFQKTENPINT